MADPDDSTRSDDARPEALMANLEPTEAQRLSRLRILLSTAATRLGDNSDAGLHVSTVAMDGAGELAIGLCVHKLGLSTKQTDGVPPDRGRGGG
jgi:hypothetical protein